MSEEERKNPNPEPASNPRDNKTGSQKPLREGRRDNVEKSFSGFYGKPSKPSEPKPENPPPEKKDE